MAYSDAVRELASHAPFPVVTDPALLADDAADWWPLAIKRAASGEAMGHPDAVVTPTSAAQVAELLALARAHGVPVIPWGLGSSVVGAPLAVGGGVMCDLSQLTGIVALSAEDLLVTARAGTMGMDLEHELNRHGLTLGHSPQSLDRSTVGGWVATRATGQFSSRYGGIEDLLVSLQVALPEHGLVRTPLAPRVSLGPDLAGLMVGAEGTFGIVTEVTLRVSPIAEHRELEALGFDDVDALLRAMREISQLGVRPYLRRGYDDAETAHLTGSDGNGCVLLLGNEGHPAVTEAVTPPASRRRAPTGAGRWAADWSRPDSLAATTSRRSRTSSPSPAATQRPSRSPPCRRTSRRCTVRSPTPSPATSMPCGGTSPTSTRRAHRCT